MSGPASASVGASATLVLDVPLSADAIASAQASGSLQLSVTLSASALAESSGIAYLPSKVDLMAAGASIATASGMLTVATPPSAWMEMSVSDAVSMISVQDESIFLSAPDGDARASVADPSTWISVGAFK